LQKQLKTHSVWIACEHSNNSMQTGSSDWHYLYAQIGMRSRCHSIC